MTEQHPIDIPQAADGGRPFQSALRGQMTEQERARRRELSNLYRRYKCPQCNSLNKDEYDARTCCGPEEVYVCPTCEEDYYDIDSVQNCMAKHSASSNNSALALNLCPVCKTAFDDCESAIDCCLWKTMPFADRLMLVDHVRFGRLDAADAMLATKHRRPLQPHARLNPEDEQ